MATERSREPGKITTELEPVILEKAGAGWSTRAIADYLTKQKGVPVSHVAIGKFLRRVKTERATTAKVVAREKLAHRVGVDCDVIEKRLKELDELLPDLKKKDLRHYFKALEAERYTLELSMRMSGVDSPDPEPEDPRAADRVLTRIATELAKRAEGESRYAAVVAALAKKTDEPGKPGGS